MKIDKTTEVVAFIWDVHGWSLSKETVKAWHHLLGDLDFEEAMKAVEHHFRTSTDPIKPAHIRRACAGTGQARQGVPQNPLPDSYVKEMQKWT